MNTDDHEVKVGEILDRTPPHNIEAELRVLSGMMQDTTMISVARGIIDDPSEFFREDHRRIFVALIAINDAHSPAKIEWPMLRDELILRDWLYDGERSDGYFIKVHGDDLRDIEDAEPSPANVSYYAKRVRDTALARQLIHHNEHVNRRAYDQSDLVHELLEDAAEGFDRIRRAAGHNLATRQRFTIRDLQDQNPHLYPPVIDGLVRQRETINIISLSKIGKSWLLYGLLLSIVTGRPWLGRFATTRGRVLLVDNELHRPTIANRIKTVAEAMEIPREDYVDAIEVWPLRGALQDIYAIARELEQIREPFTFIGIDAKYRTIPASTSENDNAAETHFYNVVDRLANQGSVIGLVHHSSKGSQGEKRITDVGAGAGAQSRAADCHLVLREHEDEGVVVLDAAVRSFAPVESMPLRWRFPLWEPADGIDPTLLKGKMTRAEEQQNDRDAETDDKVLKLTDQTRSRAELKRKTGYGGGRLDRAIRRLIEADKLVESIETRRGNPCDVYQRKGAAK